MAKQERCQTHNLLSSAISLFKHRDTEYKVHGNETSAVKQADITAVEEAGDGATTSCVDSKVQCWNCNVVMTPSHQCDVPQEPVMVVEEQPPPLPLCHYCCHRGSGEHPVHYFMQS